MKFISMQIAPLIKADLPYLAALSPEGWGDITPAFINNLNSSFCHSFKALSGQKIVGLGTVIENDDTVWLAQIIVHPAYRRQGIGTMITRTLVDSVDKNRFKTIMLDATHFGFPVYKKIGFEVVSEHLHFSGTPVSFEINYAAIIPFEGKYKQQVLDLDKLATGEGRKNSLENLLGGSFLYLSKEELVQGVYYASSSRGGLIAVNQEAGIELMKYKLSTKDYGMLPADNSLAINFLTQNGYKQIRASYRMHLGPRPDWNPAYIFNCISGAIG